MCTFQAFHIIYLNTLIVVIFEFDNVLQDLKVTFISVFMY